MVTTYDMCQMSTATSGTGTITLGSAVAGFQTFNGIVPNNVVISYGITDTGNAWEVGRGTYTNTASSANCQLTRGALYSSAGAATAISLSGSAKVFVTCLAEDLNTMAVSNSVYVGNSTINVSSNSSYFIIANSTAQTVFSTGGYSFGNTTANSYGNTIITVLAEATTQTTINTSAISIGNSTANGYTNSIINIVSNSTSQTVITPLSISIGNSTANHYGNSITLFIANSSAQTTLTPYSIQVGGSGVLNASVNSIAISIAQSAANTFTINSTGFIIGAGTSNVTANTTTPAIKITQSAANTMTINAYSIVGPVAGTNTFMGGANSIAVTSGAGVVVNGYSYLVNGLKLQWGQTVANSLPYVGTFAAPGFTTNAVAWGITIGLNSTLLFGANTPYVTAVNATTISVKSACVNGAQTVIYWALGQ